MMKSTWIAFALGLLGVVSASPEPGQAVQPWTDFTKNPVFYPSRDAKSWRSLYARTLQLPDKSILMTWDDYDPTATLTYWPIYKSTDGGASFQPFSRVEDKVNGWGNWWNPHLYALPKAFGGFPAGTILISGVSLPRDYREGYIDLYASRNGGKDWEFVSHIVYGPGPITVRNGDKAIWEPFIMLHEDKLICYYSTQVDPKHAQKLSHKTSTDLRNWSAEVDDVASSIYAERPGMTVVAYSPISKKYVMSFENCDDAVYGGCPTYYKISDSPLTFQSAAKLLVNPGNVNDAPNSNPYIIWTPEPGRTNEGIFILSGGSREELFINTDALNPNGWKPVNVNQWSAYSRSLRVIDTPADSAAKGKKKLLLANGGNMGCSGSCYNFVADAVVDIPTYPRT
ncbi:hypothetical protein ACHAQH_009639 [Verticillium albo-atrum]